jgi:hypothetical protein
VAAETVPHDLRFSGAEHLKRHGVDAGVPAGQVAVGIVFLDAAGIASVIATKGRRRAELVTPKAGRRAVAAAVAAVAVEWAASGRLTRQ